MVTLIYTTQDDLVEYAELPPPTSPAVLTTPTATSQAIAGPNPGKSESCSPTPGSMSQFYIPNTPFTTTLVPPDLILPGSPLMIFGTVYASDCRTPLPDTLIEVWHADAGGHYDDAPPFILRGQMRTDAKGRYQFTTIKPGRSQLDPETPPANIHFRVSHRDEPALYTQLFFAGDPLLSRFPFARPPLITTLTEQVGPEAMILRGKFDIILPVSPTASTSTD